MGFAYCEVLIFGLLEGGFATLIRPPHGGSPRDLDSAKTELKTKAGIHRYPPITPARGLN